MPSMEESRRYVRHNLDEPRQEAIDHDAILAGLQDEIDQHNAVQEDLRASIRRSSRRRHHSEERHASERPMKFRFKSRKDSPQEQKHKSDPDRHHRKHRKRGDKYTKHSYPTPPSDETSTQHPFPREQPNTPPADIPTNNSTTSSEAFRTALFDALASDEGAAYWESVYAQPIHIYPPPNPAAHNDGVDQMTEAEYIDHVKQQMWERKNPEIVREREEKEKERREKDEERTRRREEFVRRRERAAWERAQSAGRAEEEYEFTGQANRAPSRERVRGDAKEEKEKIRCAQAWQSYLASWSDLRRDLLAFQNPANAQNETAHNSSKESLANRIPWPLLPKQNPSADLSKANIETFMRNVPVSDGDDDGGKEKLRLLKVERVRWHPDKMKQLFAGVALDEMTMGRVAEVFRAVDGVVGEVRK